MPRGLNRQGDFRNGSPVTTPIDFGTDITLPHDFGNDVTWPTPDPAHFGNAVTWLPNPAHFGNIITPPYPAPTFTSAIPNRGPAAGGTSVAIVGSGFSVPGLEVLIGGAPCTSVVASDDTHLTCNSPAGSAGATDIEILTDGGSVDTPNAWTYNVPAPVLIAHTVSVIVGVTPAIDTTGADFIIAVANAGNTNSITDSFNNTWTPLTAGNASVGPTFFYAANPVVGTNHIFHDGGTSSQLAIAAFSGVSNSPYESDVMGSVILNPATIQPGNILAASVGDLLFTSVGVLLPTGPSSVDSGFTITDQNTSLAQTLGIALAYKVASDTSAVNPTWTLASNNRAQANASAFAHA
jgi:hypothetical protein